jgi:hypothetical protein
VSVLWWVILVILGAVLSWPVRHLLDWLFLPRVKEAWSKAVERASLRSKKQKLNSQNRFLMETILRRQNISDARNLLLHLQNALAHLAFYSCLVLFGFLIQPLTVSSLSLKPFGVMIVISGMVSILDKSWRLMETTSLDRMMLLDEKSAPSAERLEKIRSALEVTGLTITEVLEHLETLKDDTYPIPPSTPPQ